MSESNGWTLVKLFGLLRELFERSKGLFGLIAAAGGLGGWVASYYPTYAQYQPYILAFVAIVVLSIAVAVTWIVAYEKYRARDERVATEFVRLEEVYLPFEREAIKLLYQVARSSTDTPHVIDATTLKELHADYLEAICNAAVAVFEARKSRKIPITANIKRIEEKRDARGSATFVYRPLVRSPGYNRKRRAYEESLEDNPLRVQDNYVYRRIFDPHYKDDFFAHDNVGRLLKHIEDSKELAEEPNEESTNGYRSFIIFPILGLMDGGAAGVEAPLGNYMQYKGKNVFGLMCVDSAETNTFNFGADADIMSQLTSYAFGAFRLFQAIYDLARQKGLSVR